ncbi:phosphotransferase [Actinocatenispora sera]|uniref:Aminoglycoside phosphotransferase domain-containing protein n=1 Tax=Actinocatenispora sera TaxID=390989 RepID=A0A810L5L7_9ACTN|nr:phosphotransferase [Actinocatenispora sera]BCJ29588.1 hypothetical protein Asera_36960 [Actinocatenispora sera]BCJ29631.1 hypothetical protein Asera_37390 [Actinocatenispora sera]BCJ29651.1 hypothetical protein Asera_37590 [Actinocatenispora sera]BCJ29671.1 hypothetical protein Asera_37790 [Actinocatenispora sera]
MFEPIAVSTHVLAGISARWPELAEPWSMSVAGELHELCVRYNAEPIAVLPARFGLVVKANTPDGQIVLRSSPDPNGRHQGAISVALAQIGVSPQVHEVSTTDHGTWTVMDMIEPGTPLGDQNVLPEPEQVAAMLGPLIGQPAPTSDLPNLVDWLRDRLTDDRLRDLAPGCQVASTKERRAALADLDTLALNHVPGLCHADASPWNVLAGKHERLYLIDPRGISGEVSYDAAIIALKAAPHRPVKLTAKAISTTLNIDARRVLAWASIAAIARV